MENSPITELLSSVSEVSSLTSGEKAATVHISVSGITESQKLRMRRPHRFIAGPWAPSAACRSRRAHRAVSEEPL